MDSYLIFNKNLIISFIIISADRCDASKDRKTPILLFLCDFEKSWDPNMKI